MRVSSQVSVYTYLAVSGAITSSSDMELKDNVKDVDTDVCMNLLDSITTKTYTRNDMNNEKRIGFIADDFS